MKNKKIVFIAGFIIGSLIFGFASNFISQIIYKKFYTEEVKNNPAQISDWKAWKNKHDVKPWELK